MPKIDISAEPAAPPEAGVKVHVRKGEDMDEITFKGYRPKDPKAVKDDPNDYNVIGVFCDETNKRMLVMDNFITNKLDEHPARYVITIKRISDVKESD